MSNNVFTQIENDKQEFKTPSRPSFGTVVSYNSANRTAVVVVDGQTSGSSVVYRCIRECTPSAGSRVFFTRESGTPLIIGTI